MRKRLRIDPGLSWPVLSQAIPRVLALPEQLPPAARVLLVRSLIDCFEQSLGLEQGRKWLEQINFNVNLIHENGCIQGEQLVKGAHRELKKIRNEQLRCFLTKNLLAELNGSSIEHRPGCNCKQLQQLLEELCC